MNANITPNKEGFAMKKRTGFLSALLIVTTLVCLSGTAHATSVDWTASGGGSDFDTYTIAFVGFTANTLDGVTDGVATQGYWHNHDNGTPIAATLEVRVDGGWQQIWSAVTINTSYTPGDNVMPDLISNISFSGGVVDGLRLNAYQDITVAFHHQNGMVYNFSNNIAHTPEPSTIVLLGSGLVGLIGYRMRKVLA